MHVSCGLAAAFMLLKKHPLKRALPRSLSSLKLRAVRVHDAEVGEFQLAHLLRVAQEIGKGEYLPHPRVRQ